MPDIFPRADDQFDAWQANFIAKVFVHAATLGLVAGDYGPATVKQSVWNLNYPAFIASDLAIKIARAAKNTAGGEYRPELRILWNRANASNQMTDAIAADMGVDRTPGGGGGGAPPPLGPPVIIDVKTDLLLKHIVNWRDAANPAIKAKPELADAAKVYMKIDGPPPVSTAQMEFVARDKYSPYTHDFDAADVGKRVYYAVLWTTDDDPAIDGPQSEIFSAIVTG